MATRSRSDRAAVLASSVQRSKSTPYPSKARSALIRRAVVVVLVLVALTLVTIAFRSPTTGALHSVQGAGSTALRPFQVAATRVAQPFRDAYDYVHSLANAKAENKKLRKQNAELRLSALIARERLAKAPDYAKLLHLERGSRFPDAYRPINADVISNPGGPFAHTLTIGRGSSSGVRMNSPVVSGDGLVGIVSNVFPDAASVTLLTSPGYYVEARDLTTGVRGGVVPSSAGGGTLVLSGVEKTRVVHKGDVLVTNGTHSARYPDLYPYGILIGRVATKPGATDTDPFLQVQVQPYANLGSLDALAVLVPKKSHR